jgi:uncharacterized protein (DUF924 family)
MERMQEVLDFWLNDVGYDGWYEAVDAVDAEIRRKFLTLWGDLLAGRIDHWCSTAQGALAFLIIADQFSRNMFRGDGRSFAADSKARDVARVAIARNLDMEVPEPQRVFFYMPFEHSEDFSDQDWSVSLMDNRLPATGKEFAVHTRAHREIIRRFGRFPFRNKALGRVSSADEEAFMSQGGYGSVVRELDG